MGKLRFCRRVFVLVASLVGGGLLGCQQRPPAVVTQEVITVEGQMVVVTRLVRQTVAAPVTPLATAAPGDPIELDVSLSGGVTTLDPQLAVEANDLTLIENLFVGLTHYNHRQNRVEPELAQSWEVSEDGRTWIFHLRSDVYWVRREAESGLQAVRLVTAHDVVYAIRRVCHPAVAAPEVFIFFIIQGCEEVSRLAETTEADLAEIGVRALDDFTLQISLTKPAGYFPALTTLSLLRPVPAERVEQFGAEWTAAENLVSSGPFWLTANAVTETRTVLRRNPYWPLPFTGNVDRVNLLHLADELDAFKLWEDKELDTSPLPAEMESEMMSRSPQKVVQIPEQVVFYLAYNLDSPAFRVPEVRRAFGAAIDRTRLIEEIYGGKGIAMLHFAPAGVLGAPPVEQIGVGYDPDYARLQMQASGFGDCRLLPPITYLVSASDLALRHAELLREMWVKELACTEEQITIEQVQFGTLLANTRRQAGAMRPDIWDLGWASYYPDENNWVGDVLHCTDSENRPNRPCSEVDDLIRQAAATVSDVEREALYRQVESLFFSREGIEPLTPLYMRVRLLARQSWLSFTPAAFGGEQFDTYVIDATTKDLEQNR
ncbi:MAG: peptide ABC transporter substrate-binding protein [Chloroflexota bacterium]